MQADDMQDAGPGRRSTEDLQRILESLMGDREVVLSGELPDRELIATLTCRPPLQPMQRGSANGQCCFDTRKRTA